MNNFIIVLFIMFIISLITTHTINKLDDKTKSFSIGNLGCKCAMNKDIEHFSNIDIGIKKSKKKFTFPVNRYIGIKKSKFDLSARQYYENLYKYPIKPLNIVYKFAPINYHKYKNLNNTNLLNPMYENNDIVSGKYLIGK